MTFLLVLSALMMIMSWCDSIFSTCPGFSQYDACYSTDLTCPSFVQGSCRLPQTKDAILFCEGKDIDTLYYYCVDQNCFNIGGYMNATQGDSNFACVNSTCPGTVSQQDQNTGVDGWQCTSNSNDDVYCPTHWALNPSTGNWSCFPGDCDFKRVLINQTDNQIWECPDLVQCQNELNQCQGAESSDGLPFLISTIALACLFLLSIMYIIHLKRQKRGNQNSSEVLVNH